MDSPLARSPVLPGVSFSAPERAAGEGQPAPQGRIPRAAQPSGSALDVEAAWVQHGEGVRRFLSRLGLSRADAEDLAVEVFLVAHEKRSSFDAERPVRPWLFGIAVKLAQRQRRRLLVRRLLSLGLERQPAPEVDDPLGNLLGREDEARVRRALLALPEKKRALLVLREWEELSVAEIGRTLSMPEATVCSALHYARRELLKQYRRLLVMEATR